MTETVREEKIGERWWKRLKRGGRESLREVVEKV